MYHFNLGLSQDHAPMVKDLEEEGLQELTEVKEDVAELRTYLDSIAVNTQEGIAEIKRIKASIRGFMTSMKAARVPITKRVNR